MPEGVEVRLSADLIKPLIINKIVCNAFVGKKSRYVNDPPEGFSSFISHISNNPTKVKSVDTKGKFMYWSFDDDWYLFSTFGMTGQWSPKEGKHPCFGFYLGNPDSFETMYFNDPRHFGTIKFVKGKNLLNDKLNELGWDPLVPNSLNNFYNFIKRKTLNAKPIGQLLMDQSIFAGVGNYIRAEALYLAKISPWRPGNSLSDPELNLLCNSIINVMEESYKYQGATIQTYKTAYGEEGRYTSFFKVYGKKHDPMGNFIVTQNTPDKRTIHWCPNIQK